jgi:hypothetical protein
MTTDGNISDDSEESHGRVVITDLNKPKLIDYAMDEHTHQQAGIVIHDENPSRSYSPPQSQKRLIQLRNLNRQPG